MLCDGLLLVGYGWVLLGLKFKKNIILMVKKVVV